MINKNLSALLSISIILTTFVANTTTTTAAHGVPAYRLEAIDQGPVFAPSNIGDPYFQFDGNGVREANIFKVENTYYLFYDGAAQHEGACPENDPEKHLWRACLAKSTNLLDWTKLGPRLMCGYDEHPESNPTEYKDFWSASSPWVYFNQEDNYWYMFYLGAIGAAPSGGDVGTPATDYNTCVAKAQTQGIYGIEGNWDKVNNQPGKSKAVAFYKSTNAYPIGTTSPGPVIQNPLWQGASDIINKRYMMFFTSGATIGIARTNDLSATQNYDEPANPNGWNVDKMILGHSTAPENANCYYDENTGWYYLFTNELSQDYTYADMCAVYWSKDPNNWNEANSAVILDKNNTKDGWATGAIGMPSVVKIDDTTLAVMYDASVGSLRNHTDRQIGLAYWTLPELDENGVPKIDKPFYDYTLVNNTDQGITYSGGWTHANQSNPNDYNSDLHYTNTNGSYAEYKFIGNTIKWIGEKAFNRGIADVYIDGVFDKAVDCYDSAVLYQRDLYTKTGLSPGDHTIKIVCTGTNNAAASDRYIDIDLLKYKANFFAINNNDARIKYSGDWTYANPSNGNDFNADLHYTNTNGSYLEFSFIGNSVKWIGEKVYNRGIANVYIDGVFDKAVDCYDASILYQRELYSCVGLDEGEHTLKIVCTGTNNTASSGSYIDVDSIQYGTLDVPKKDYDIFLQGTALRMDFDDNYFDSANWDLRNPAPSEYNFFTQNKFNKYSSDYWTAFFTKSKFSAGTLIEADVKVTSSGPMWVSQFIGVRCTENQIITEGESAGIWFGFTQSNNLVVSLNNGAHLSGNAVSIAIPVNFTTSRHIIINDKGSEISLYTYDDTGIIILLATVKINRNILNVIDSAGINVFTKAQTVNAQGNVSFVAFGCISEIDNIKISNKYKLELYNDTVLNSNMTDTLMAGNSVLRVYKPANINSAVIACALYKDDKLEKVTLKDVTTMDEYADINITIPTGSSYKLKIMMFQATDNIKPLSTFAIYE